MITYTFENDVSLLRGATRELRAVAKSKTLRRALKVIGFIGLLLLLIMCIHLKVWILVFCIAVFLIALVFGYKLDYWVAVRRLKRSMYYRTKVFAYVDDNGIRTEFEGGKTEANWSAVTKVVRRRSGYILYFDGENPSWWPDTSLTYGSIDEMSALIGSHCKNVIQS